MNKNTLIDRITPLYNTYKNNKPKMSAIEALELMWEIGNHLKIFIDQEKIKPHTLYREIYGKSEGERNIVQKSYITREFQGRCYRIRNIFSNKEQIRKDLPRLTSFTAFRESMPFFDNEKYQLESDEKKELLALLNSNLKPNDLLRKIRTLQAKKINKKNPRTQKLHEVEAIKQDFIRFYNRVYQLIKINDYEIAANEISNINKEYIRLLAKNTAALAQEGLEYFDFSIPQRIDELWIDYGNSLKQLGTQKNAKLRRRFRRLIAPERMMRLTDMLYALADKQSYQNFKHK